MGDSRSPGGYFQSLSERIAALERRRRVSMPEIPKMAAGVATFPEIPAGETAYITVPLPVGLFDTPPIVVVTPLTTIPAQRLAGVTPITTSDFRVYQYNGTDYPGAVSVSWVAMPAT